jgi:hypothetical protein
MLVVVLGFTISNLGRGGEDAASVAMLAGNLKFDDQGNPRITMYGSCMGRTADTFLLRAESLTLEKVTPSSSHGGGTVRPEEGTAREGSLNIDEPKHLVRKHLFLPQVEPPVPSIAHIDCICAAFGHLLPSWWVVYGLWRHLVPSVSPRQIYRCYDCLAGSQDSTCPSARHQNCCASSHCGEPRVSPNIASTGEQKKPEAGTFGVGQQDIRMTSRSGGLSSNSRRGASS